MTTATVNAGARLALAGPAVQQGARPSITPPLIEVAPGVRLFVRDWGSGKPIVFIHGWPSNHQIFEYQLLPLADRGYRVVGIDLRGFGQSDQPWDGNDYDIWAADIGAVLAALDLEDVTLAGYSMGGAIAAHYVATHDDPRVSKLALISAALPSLGASPDNPYGLPPEMFDGILQGLAADRASLFAEFIPNLFHAPIGPAVSGWVHALSMAASPRATVRGLEEGRDRDLRPELGAIRVPTRIFHGVNDALVMFPLAEQQQALIPGSTLVAFEQSGHVPLFEERARFNEELAEFAG